MSYVEEEEERDYETDEEERRDEPWNPLMDVRTLLALLFPVMAAWMTMIIVIGRGAYAGLDYQDALRGFRALYDDEAARR